MSKKIEVTLEQKNKIKQLWLTHSVGEIAKITKMAKRKVANQGAALNLTPRTRVGWGIKSLGVVKKPPKPVPVVEEIIVPELVNDGHEWDIVGRVRNCTKCSARQYRSIRFQVNVPEARLWSPINISSCSKSSSDKHESEKNNEQPNNTG